MSLDIGSIARIRPDDDDYDGLLVRIAVRGNRFRLNGYNLVVITGERKGEVLEDWSLLELEQVSPLELLALEADDEE